MKHEKEIDDLLRELFFQEWMNEDDFNEVITLTLKAAEISKQNLSDNLETGIKNGFPIKQQFDILKHILK